MPSLAWREGHRRVRHKSIIRGIGLIGIPKPGAMDPYVPRRIPAGRALYGRFAQGARRETQAWVMGTCGSARKLGGTLCPVVADHRKCRHQYSLRPSDPIASTTRLTRRATMVRFSLRFGRQTAQGYPPRIGRPGAKGWREEDTQWHPPYSPPSSVIVHLRRDGAGAGALARVYVKDRRANPFNTAFATDQGERHVDRR